MYRLIQTILIVFLLIVSMRGTTQTDKQPTTNQKTIMSGAERIPVYLPLLKGKKVAILANHTSLVGNRHLVDTLHQLGVNITAIFGPE
ncbi:MAG TPA: DUF1343 domain-containing protein, partial [Chitinophagaceae bacterium]|nr:DUF1343 domain-containing protein [Chitinophagaceae bacterium]